MALNLLSYDLYPESEVDPYPEGRFGLQFNIISTLDDETINNIQNRLENDCRQILQNEGYNSVNIEIEYNHYEYSEDCEEGYVFTITLSNTDLDSANNIYDILKDSYKNLETMEDDTTDSNTTFTINHQSYNRRISNAPPPQVQNILQETEYLPIGTIITIPSNSNYRNNINMFFANSNTMPSSSNTDFTNNINQNVTFQNYENPTPSEYSI